MSARKAPAEFSAYLVTASDEPAMPVGAILVDKGKMLRRDWCAMDFTTMEETGATGIRLLRLCADCKVKHGRIGTLGHDGDCGSEAVVDEARAELADAKKRVMA